MVSDCNCRISFVIVMWEAYVSLLSVGSVAERSRALARNRGGVCGTTRSDSDAALIKHRALPVKIKSQPPFDPECFLSHGDAGRTKAKYQKNETIFRQGDLADAVFYIMDGKCKVTVVSRRVRKPWSLSMRRGNSLVRAA